jgi:hypothetical protein
MLLYSAPFLTMPSVRLRAAKQSPIDMLLRVNAEDSRAVGVSGLQSSHRTTTPFGHTGSPPVSMWWAAGHAKWPIPLSSTVYGVPVLFLPRGRQQASTESRVSPFVF